MKNLNNCLCWENKFEITIEKTFTTIGLIPRKNLNNYLVNGPNISLTEERRVRSASRLPNTPPKTPLKTPSKTPPNITYTRLHLRLHQRHSI